jgi:5-methyltetrahydrofolate--homocysteine methyltransferase
MEFSELNNYILKGNVEKVSEGTRWMIEHGVDPLSIINEGLIPGMNTVGVLFKKGDMYVPEVMRCAKAMSEGVDLVRPYIADADIPTRGTVVIGTVRGDLHDIGKNLVVMMLESQGFQVIDLGVNITPEQFVDAVVKHQPKVVGMSALLTTTMPGMSETIKALENANLRDKVKVMIGGAPVTLAFANQIGADGYASDAGSVADLCGRFTA